MDNINIYVTVSDKYQWLLKPFCYLFNKFWGENQKVTFLCYKPIKFNLPSNFSFISLGEDLGPNKWSNSLINFFKTTKETHFILGLEDQFITGPIKKNILNILLKECSNPKVGRINLMRDTVNRPHSLYKKINEDFSIIEAKQNSSYRISLMWSLWNKDYFLNYLKPNMSAWEFEGNYGEKGINDGYHILGTKSKNGPPDNAPLDVSNVIWRGNSKRLNFHKSNYPHLKWDIKKGAGLDPRIVKEMKASNIIPPSIETGIIYEKIWKSY